MLDNIAQTKNLFLIEDGSPVKIGNVSSIDMDTSIQENPHSDYMVLSDGSLTIDISDISISKYHRKRKGKRYLIYRCEEYKLFDDFKSKVFGVKMNYKKLRKLGKSKKRRIK